MKRFEGIHVYINIINFDQVVIEEEKSTGSVNHAIHALDTFFSSIERYGKKLYSDTLTVEKITGSRLHLYIVDDITSSYDAARTISTYAYELSKYMKNCIPAYRLLEDFSIQVGCAYGHFYDFEFKVEDFSETTTIGYAANFAAKIQAKTGEGKLSISENIYEALCKEDRDKFVIVPDDSLRKYEQNCYYTSNLAQVTPAITFTNDDFEEARIYADKVNLNEIKYSGVQQTLDFSYLNKSNCKKLKGIPLFADVRGFTTLFDSDDANLDEMAEKTQKILQSMYRVTLDNQGVHVQFQGDRELSLYHDTTERSCQNNAGCFKRAVLSAMRLVDAVKPFSVHIGVGGDFGEIYATKIGARGEKDNIIIGKTVMDADRMEDEYAGEDQIAITADAYNGLKSEDPHLAKEFDYKNGAYVTTMSFKEYQDALRYNRHSANTKQNKYNGAWGVSE